VLRRQVTAKTRDLSRTMKDLASSEARFRAIFDNISDAIFIQDTDNGAVLLVNRRAEEMYGWTMEEFKSLDMNHGSEGVPPYDQDHALEYIRRSAIEPQTFEWRARRKDGSLFWAEISIRRAHLDSHVERILVMVHDISERKEFQERLTHSIKALTRSNTDLESFAYAASHDLREPLAVVTRYSQMLESRHLDSLGPSGAEAVGFIQKGVRQMMRLVEGLLDYARIDSGDRHLGHVDIQSVVAEVLATLSPQIEASGAHVELTSLPDVTGDELQLTQLFQNLISNAVKFRVADHPLRISISGCRLSDGTCEFRVCDNGIGIEAPYRDQVFVIFKRLHTHEAIPGGGIGLALCKRIVERHAGQIRIEDTPGGGASLIFTIGTVTE
jgi:PAS domain S-box-containing protein